MVGNLSGRRGASIRRHENMEKWVDIGRIEAAIMFKAYENI